MQNTLLKEGIITERDSGKRVPYKMVALLSEDIEKMLKLQNDIFEEGGFNKAWFFPFAASELEAIIEGKGNLATGIMVDDEIVAFRISCVRGKEFLEISQILGGAYKEGEGMLLNGVFVKKNYRGNHLQQIMSRYIIEVCEKRGIEVLMTAIHPDNVASIKSLENLGFKRKERAVLYDSRYDRIIMVKENCQNEKR